MTETTDSPIVAQPEAKTPESGEANNETVTEEQTNGTSTPDKETKDDKEPVDPPKEMRAIVLTGFGGYKGVKILKKPEPVVQTGEVLIRVRAW